MQQCKFKFFDLNKTTMTKLFDSAQTLAKIKAQQQVLVWADVNIKVWAETPKTVSLQWNLLKICIHNVKK